MTYPGVISGAFLAVSICLGACGSSLPNYDYSKEPNPKQGDWVLGVSDAVSINVFEHTELTTNATIRPDGKITMPLVGDLRAVDKTTAELKEEIRAKLAQYYKDKLEITIAITTWASYNFTISGEVNSPGILNSDRYVTVVEAIALAGGFTRFAEKNKMVLTRTDLKTGKLRRIPLAYDPIVNGERLDMNLVLVRGDRLHVP